MFKRYLLSSNNKVTKIEHFSSFIFYHQNQQVIGKSYWILKLPNYRIAGMFRTEKVSFFSF